MFDIVSMAAGLHHMADVNGVLREMKRALKPGGWLVIREMFRDNQSDKQMSHVYSHHWSAKIGRLLGKSHNSTFKRQEILDLIGRLNLTSIQSGEFICRKCDPEKDGKMEEEIADIDTQLAEIESHPRYEELKEEGERIRRYIKKTGFACATQLDVVGIK